jgi:hypothetical protein
MKKKLLHLCLAFITSSSIYAQCIPTCSSYAVSQITYTTFPSAGTNPLSTFLPNTDDGVTPLISIGFNFNFYCTTYSDIRICTNGFLQFNNGVPAVANGFADPTQTFPSAVAPNAMVAFHMNDLDPGVGGTITYTTIGTTPNQKFILTFSNVPIFAYSSSLNTGQIVLYETTNIIEIYTGTVTNGSTTNGTQGIENDNGTAGAAVSGRNNVIWNATNSAYQFSPFTPAPPTSVTGNTILCQGESGFYNSSIMTGASAYVWALPSGWSGTSTLTTITATAGVAGNLSVSATYTCGTSAPATLAVNVVQAPVVTIVSASPNILCSGSNITFSTSGAITYTLNPGSISGVPPFTDIATVSTIYTLSGTDANGCVSQNNPTALITVKETPTVTVNSGTVCNGQPFTMTPSGAPSYVYSSLFPTVTPSVGIYSYSVTGTGTNGCISLPAVSVLTVFALPTVTAVASRTAMCLKESITLTAGGAATYTWNTNTTAASFSVSPNSTTVYSVNGTDARGCINAATVAATVKTCVGLNEINGISIEPSIFPNPSKGLFQIRSNAANENTSLEIFNSVGQLILKKQLTAETTEIDLLNFSNGFYFVKVITADNQSILKIIKE